MKNHKLILIIKVVLFFFLAVILFSNLYILTMWTVFKKNLPKVFGFAQAVVISGSMQPAIDVGDLLIIREQKEYKVNDIVTFEWDNSLVTHRIIAIEGNRAITKGDSNNVADEPILLSQIEGRVVLSLSVVGQLFLFLKSPFGILVMVILAILIIELPKFFDRNRHGS